MKHPIQPLSKDAEGVIRFKENTIVRRLLDYAQAHGMGLNEIAMQVHSDDDRQQFAQLIGYSLDGYGSLRSYVSDEAYSAACQMADGMNESDARVAALTEKLDELREAINMLREPVARLLEMHPDDLRQS